MVGATMISLSIDKIGPASSHNKFTVEFSTRVTKEELQTIIQKSISGIIQVDT
jgi:hypothetical protein